VIVGKFKCAALLQAEIDLWALRHEIYLSKLVEEERDRVIRIKGIVQRGCDVLHGSEHVLLKGSSGGHTLNVPELPGKARRPRGLLFEN
jgi:hypothetical protein